MLAIENLVVPVLGSLIAGMAIGFEREWRSRPAGMRTHTLVCLASALLMIAAANQAEWTMTLVPGERVVTDPTRMAHGILTGVGFLCAGVIFREGLTVQGLATATSLWTTAGLGMLFGIGLIELAAFGTVVVISILVLFRLSYTWLPRRKGAVIVVQVRSDAGFDGAAFRALLNRVDLQLVHENRKLLDRGASIEFDARVFGSNILEIDRIAEALSGIAGIEKYEVAPYEDHHA